MKVGLILFCLLLTPMGISQEELSEGNHLWAIQSLYYDWNLPPTATTPIFITLNLSSLLQRIPLDVMGGIQGNYARLIYPSTLDPTHAEPQAIWFSATLYVDYHKPKWYYGLNETARIIPMRPYAYKGFQNLNESILIFDTWFDWVPNDHYVTTPFFINVTAWSDPVLEIADGWETIGWSGSHYIHHWDIPDDWEIDVYEKTEFIIKPTTRVVTTTVKKLGIMYRCEVWDLIDKAIPTIMISFIIIAFIWGRKTGKEEEVIKKLRKLGVLPEEKKP